MPLEKEKRKERNHKLHLTLHDLYLFVSVSFHRPREKCVLPSCFLSPTILERIEEEKGKEDRKGGDEQKTP